MKKTKKIVSLVMCAALAATCSFGIVGGLAQNQTKSNDEFTPIFRMAVMSDIHVTPKYNTDLGKNYDKALKAAYAYADGHETYTTLDAIVISGDLTHDPSTDPYDFEAVRDITYENLRRETAFMTILGNHDLYNAENKGGTLTTNPYDGMTRYKDALDSDINKHMEVKGFHLIGLDEIVGNGLVSASGVELLNEWMEVSNSEDPDKPIFTFQHHKIEGTTYGSYSSSSYGTSSSTLNKAYSKYSQVINFSGHSHVTSSHPRAVYQDSYTVVNVPSIKGLSFTKTDPFAPVSSSATGFPSEDQTNAGGRYFMIVEVDEDYAVRMCTVSAVTGEVKTTPSTTDDPDEILTFEIDADKDPSKFKYTDARADVAADPYFESGAAISLEKAYARSVKINIPQMQDEVCPYYYRIDVTKTDGSSVKTQVLVDKFYHGDNTGAETVTVDGLTAKTDYVLTVIPVNIWGKEGSPLTLNATTI